MKEYESPKAELLQLEDVITASGAAEPCKCVAYDSGPGCKATASTGAYESKASF